MKHSLFYGQMANEETNLFNRRPSWNQEDALDEKYLEFLAPHSRAYFSRLRPFFSFEVKALNGLNSFSHVLFRDGIIFLLRFFVRYPVPQGLKCKILIEKNLAFTVPKAWQDHVYLYETVMLEKTRPLNKSSANNLVIILNLHENQEQLLLKDVVAKEVAKREKVFLLPYFNQMRGEDYLNYDRAENLMSLKELFSEKVSVINRSDLAQFDSRDSVFINANPQQVFLSDSNVVHSFLRSGWENPLLNYANEGDFVVSLSPYHGMRINTFELNKNQELLAQRLFQELDFPRADLFNGEPILNRDQEDYFKVFYYSRDLLELSYELGKGLYHVNKGESPFGQIP